jgi:hypothetical protein
VKDLKVFNLSLLAKWRWRLLADDKPQWRLVLEAKYGVVGDLSLSISRNKIASTWWGWGLLRVLREIG